MTERSSQRGEKSGRTGRAREEFDRRCWKIRAVDRFPSRFGRQTEEEEELVSQRVVERAEGERTKSSLADQVFDASRDSSRLDSVNVEERVLPGEVGICSEPEWERER